MSPARRFSKLWRIIEGALKRVSSGRRLPRFWTGHRGQLDRGLANNIGDCLLVDKIDGLASYFFAGASDVLVELLAGW